MNEAFWSSLPGAVVHPTRVPMLEALWWIGEPLSALQLVDVLDGRVSMWDARYHLRVLEVLEAVEPVAPNPGKAKRDDPFAVPFRLSDQWLEDAG